MGDMNTVCGKIQSLFHSTFTCSYSWGLEGYVHVTPYTILYETTEKHSECRWVFVMEDISSYGSEISIEGFQINPLNPKLNPICYLLALLGAHHFLHVSRISVKLLTFRRLMSYIYIWSTHS